MFYNVLLFVLQSDSRLRLYSLVYSLYAILCFSGTKVDWWLTNYPKKCHFFCFRFILACRLILYACVVEKSLISEFCVFEIRAVPIQTINEWRKLKHFILFCNADKINQELLFFLVPRHSWKDSAPVQKFLEHQMCKVTRRQVVQTRVQLVIFHHWQDP